MNLIRVALCQIECHPAIYASHLAFLEEPFLSKGGSLSKLGTQAINVSAIQSSILRDYLKWQASRVNGILDFLAALTPAPDLVLFPEGSLPIQCLLSVAEWSAKLGATVLAGTHTPLQHPAAKQIYRDIGLRREDLGKAFKYGARNVLPVIASGKPTLLRKRRLSVFETSPVEPEQAEMPALRPLAVTASGRQIKLLPLVCAEALQLHNVNRAYDIVGIVAYDADPSHFHNYIQHQVANKKLVLFCNDGAFGGTTIGFPADWRAPDWFRDAFPLGLPAGDSIMVADLDLSATAVEVGTTVPSRSFRLARLSSILYETEPNSGSKDNLDVIYSISDDSSVRAARLDLLLRSGQLDALQRKRVERLYEEEARGTPSEQWWKTLGGDCQIRGLPSLRNLEAQLAANCEADLMSRLSVKIEPNAASALLSYIAECQKRSSGAKSIPLTPAAESLAVIDREREVKSVLDFLDHPTELVLEISGLPEIGKTSVLKKVMSQPGLAGSLRIQLSDSSSADFIIYSILQHAVGAPKPPYSAPLELCASPFLISALRSVRLLVFERCQFLLEGSVWRDNTFPALLSAIIEVASSVKSKVIIEARRELPLELENTSIRRRLQIRGLYRESQSFGVALFDSQLRRVGLSPSSLDLSKKEDLVDRLGGHPVAIALAADSIYEEGYFGLAESLKQKKGAIFSFLARLVRALSLTDEERTVLQLLRLAREPVPRETILGAVTFPATGAIRNLISLGAIEVTTNNYIVIAGSVREYLDLGNIDRGQMATFHRRASIAFSEIAQDNPRNLAAAVEAEFHANLAGIEAPVSTYLIDGALGSARTLFGQQRYEEASKILSLLIDKHPTQDVLRLSALVEARCNRFSNATELARSVFRKNPRDTWLLVELAKIALTQFQEDHARELVEIARKAGVEDVSVLIVEGRISLRNRDFANAEARLKRAVQLTERDPWPYYYLGIVYLRLGRIGEAIDALSDGEEFYYGSNARGRNVLNAIRTQLAWAYFFDERLDLAAPILESLIREDPRPEVIRAYAAVTVKRDGIDRAHEAIKKLEEAPARNSYERSQQHLLLGIFYLGIDDPQAASREFSKAHAADNSNVFVMMKWARTLFDLGVSRHLEADEMYRNYIEDCVRLVKKILRFDPDNSEGIDLLQRLHRRFNVAI